jgi:hypothetical protein
LKQSYNPFVSQEEDDEVDFKSCMIRDQPFGGGGSNTHLSDMFQAAAAKQSHVLDEIKSQKSEVQDDYQECESQEVS